MLSLRQKPSACKTVLKSHVNGLVSPQGMTFLDIEISFQKYSVVIYKLQLNLKLIKINFKKFIWRVIDILRFRVSRFFLSSFWFSIICHASIGPTSNNPRVFFKRCFLINTSFKANIFRLLLKNLFLINFYFSREAFIRKIMEKNLTWLRGSNAVKEDIKAFFPLCEIKSTYIDIL